MGINYRKHNSKSIAFHRCRLNHDNSLTFAKRVGLSLFKVAFGAPTQEKKA